MQTFTITDPREFDGDPYEVVGRAIDQAKALCSLYEKALKDTMLMARNAEMERQLYFTGEPDPSAFTNGPQGRKFDGLIEDAQVAQRLMCTLHTAATYDPKNPPKV